MDEFLAQLRTWQPLVAALITGIIALLSAYFVAQYARRREEVAAGMFVIAELERFNAASKVVYPVTQGNLADTDLLKHATEMKKLRPTLSPLFDAMMARVMPIDFVLADHLRTFRDYADQLDRIFASIDAGVQQIRENHAINRMVTSTLKDPLKSNLEEAFKSMQEAAKMAQLAEPLLQSLILGYFPTFRRVFRRLKRYKSSLPF